MKRFTALAVCWALLAALLPISASASGAGSSSDPLATRSYVNDYLAAIIEKSASDTTKALAERYEASLSSLEELYDSQLMRLGAYSGYRLPRGYEQLTLDAGGTASLLTGASFVLVSGSASVSVTRGTVINASTGSTVASGSAITAKQRYFCAENTAAVFTASSRSSVSIDGWYKASTSPKPEMSFTDVPRDQWYYDAVSFVYSRGLFEGTSGTEFSPALSMTRAMFVTVLYRLDGEPEGSGSSPFTDVTDASQWYYKAVMWAASKGIVNGYDDATFRPTTAITREQMALIMYKYVKYRGISVSGVSPDRLESFPDSGSVSSWARDALVWAADVGIINGSDGYIIPAGTATRAQVAQIIKNCCTEVPGL